MMAPTPFKQNGVIIREGEMGCTYSAVVLFVLELQSSTGSQGPWQTMATKSGSRIVLRPRTFFSVAEQMQCSPGTYRDVFRLSYRRYAGPFSRFRRGSPIVHLTRTSAPIRITCP